MHASHWNQAITTKIFRINEEKKQATIQFESHEPIKKFL